MAELERLWLYSIKQKPRIFEGEKIKAAIKDGWLHHADYMKKKHKPFKMKEKNEPVKESKNKEA